MKWFNISLISLIILLFGIGSLQAKKAVAQKGREILMEYILTVDGTVIDSSQGRDPKRFILGRGEILSGLERRIQGMQAGEEKDIALPCEEAYGRIDPKAFQEVPRSKLPANVEPLEGMFFQLLSTKGATSVSRIAQVKKDTVVMDFNHPLAGKTLNFHIKIISIK